MMNLFGFLAVPLGYILRLVYGLIQNYFAAIFLFTLIMRLLLFPLSLMSQKKQSDRIRLAPRVERLQKKYKQDPKKLQAKQQALYEKEGVSLTGGCMPTIVQMIVLFGIIAVIYKPLSYLTTDVPSNVVTAAVTAVNIETYTKDATGTYTYDKENAPDVATYAGQDGETLTINLKTKLSAAKASTNSYYCELEMMKAMDENRDEIIRSIQKQTDGDTEKAVFYYDKISGMRSEFTFGNYSLLDQPWGAGGFKDISLLWLIPLISGLTAVLVSVISLRYSKMGMSQEKQPGQGCSNFGMMLFMPLFSLYISFTVPGGVGVYWICSNVIAMLQTIVLNMIYNPKKIREQAEIDYQERRRLRAEQKKQTLADARRRDEEQEKEAEEAARLAAEQASKMPASGKKQKKLNLEIGEFKKDENENTKD